MRKYQHKTHPNKYGPLLVYDELQEDSKGRVPNLMFYKDGNGELLSEWSCTRPITSANSDWEPEVTVVDL